MELIVNDKLKKDMRKKIISKNKSLKIIRNIVIWTSMIGIFGSMFYITLSALIPGMHMARINGVLEKNWWLIMQNASLFLVSSLFGALVMHILLLKLSNCEIGERRVETMIVMKNKIRYTYMSNETSVFDRIVFIIRYDRIQSIDYDAQLSKITLHGAFSADVIEDYKNNSFYEPRKENQTEIVIFDYFNPNLYKTLQEKGVEVKINE